MFEAIITYSDGRTHKVEANKLVILKSKLEKFTGIISVVIYERRIVEQFETMKNGGDEFDNLIPLLG